MVPCHLGGCWRVSFERFKRLPFETIGVVV
jgi:hypothetical protein